MLAERRSIEHPTHGVINTPLLVPAFSSKGFKLTASSELGHDYSEVAYILDQFPTYDAESVLVSGYDLHYRHFEVPDSVVDNDVLGKLGTSEAIIVDSGGYELSRDFDTSQVKRFQYEPKDDYGRDQYMEVLESLTSGIHPAPLIITNFDHGTRGESFEEQIREARELFDCFDGVASTFILKPGPGRTRLNLDELSPRNIQELRTFDAIGVTEKELGSSLKGRIAAICSLREKLVGAELRLPIHIWGGLDPILTPLYFFAGADVFDGLSWLRYGFINGLSISREAAQVLDDDLGVTASKKTAEFALSMKNYRYMKRLEILLAQWADYEGERFDMFEDGISRVLEKAYSDLRTQLPNLRGSD